LAQGIPLLEAAKVIPQHSVLVVVVVVGLAAVGVFVTAGVGVAVVESCKCVLQSKVV
jgi:hypothetical protein